MSQSLPGKAHTADRSHVDVPAFIDECSILETRLITDPSLVELWLRLGQLREARTDRIGALKAYYQAVIRAQRASLWHSSETTPPHLLEAVIHAISVVRYGRKDLLRTAYDQVREIYGGTELSRVDHALSMYLGEVNDPPQHPQQCPRFFYFPGLPSGPYHDPMLQPWAANLKGSFEKIREDAVRVMAEDGHFENFINFRDGIPIEKYLHSQRGRPGWEAFFFYRHGKRFDNHHARCKNTSDALDSIELCRIEGAAPEICFSIMTPGTEILPHYGVTNIRLVMHLPLLVPENCALNVIGIGSHQWQPGKLMMFDDTFQHEAWNRSNNTRVILLMDCWNPHLTTPEKLALKQMIETISGLSLAGKGQQ